MKRFVFHLTLTILFKMSDEEEQNYVFCRTAAACIPLTMQARLVKKYVVS